MNKINEIKENEKENNNNNNEITNQIKGPSKSQTRNGVLRERSRQVTHMFASQNWLKKKKGLSKLEIFKNNNINLLID